MPPASRSGVIIPLRGFIVEMVSLRKMKRGMYEKRAADGRPSRPDPEPRLEVVGV
jgi:hypothetical protein